MTPTGSTEFENSGLVYPESAALSSAAPALVAAPPPKNCRDVSVALSPRRFSAQISEVIYQHRRALGLNARAVELLGVLLLHCRKEGRTSCYPSQKRLAAFCDCSIQTVERAVSRLTRARVNGLPLVCCSWQRRPEGGRRRVYDLAGALVLNPSKLLHGLKRADHAGAGRGADPPEDQAENRAQATPHFCPPETQALLVRNNSGDQDQSRQDVEDVGGQGLSQADRQTAQALTQKRVHAPLALSLVKRHGRERCQRCLDHLPSKGIGHSGKWLYRAITKGYEFDAPSPARRGAPAPASPPAAARPDPLGALPAARRLLLEARAKEELLSSAPPPLRRQLERGQAQTVVRSRMRALLERDERDQEAGPS